MPIRRKRKIKRKIQRKTQRKLIQLEANQTSEFRKRIHEQQGMICPICKQYTEHIDTTLDHQHKLRKSETIGNNGAGLIRGVLCRACNTYEGKIWNNFTRLGFHKKGIGRAEFLRNLADYYDRGTYNYIHPSEKPKSATMGIRLFNRINKAYKVKYPNRKELEIPKSAIIRKGVRKGQIGKWKITKKWENLIKEFDIEV